MVYTDAMREARNKRKREQYIARDGKTSSILDAADRAVKSKRSPSRSSRSSGSSQQSSQQSSNTFGQMGDNGWQPNANSQQAEQNAQQPGLPNQQEQPNQFTDQNGQLQTVGSNESYLSATGEYQFDFFTPEGQKERLTNVYDVMRLALSGAVQDLTFGIVDLTPDEAISADTGNKTLDSVAEWIAENPSDAAGIAAAGITSVKSAYTAIQAAGGLGQAAMSGKQLVLKGVNTLRTRSIVSLVVQAATTLNAHKATVLAGLGLFSMGVGAEFFNAHTQTQAFNDAGDVILGQGVGAAELHKMGRHDLAREVEDNIAEFRALANELFNEKDGLLKNFKDIKTTGLAKVNLLADNSALLAQGWEEKEVLETMNTEKNVRFTEQMQTMTPEEIVANPEMKLFGENPDNWSYSAHKLYNTALTQVSNAKAYGGEDTDGESNTDGGSGNGQQPDWVREYDEETGESTPTDADFAQRRNDAEYNQILYGKDYTGERTTQEAPSTLGFGLLKTGGETRTDPIDTNDMAGIEVLDSIAERLFGVPFNELSPALQAIVNQNA